MPEWLQCLTNYPCYHCATGIHIHISPFYRERTLESFWFTRHPFRKYYEKIISQEKDECFTEYNPKFIFLHSKREKITTRMHSSRMRTVRNSSRLRGVYLPRGYLVLGGMPSPGGCTCLGVYLVPGGGVPAKGGVPGPRGFLPRDAVPAGGGGGGTWSGGCTWSRGVYLPGGVPGPRGEGICPGTLPVNRMTDRCKNITFATSLRTVKNRIKACSTLTPLVHKLINHKCVRTYIVYDAETVVVRSTKPAQRKQWFLLSRLSVLYLDFLFVNLAA